MAKVIYEFDDEVQDDVLKMMFLLKKPEICSLLFDLMTSNFQSKIEGILDSECYVEKQKHFQKSDEFKSGYYEGAQLVLEKLQDVLSQMNLTLEDITY